MRVIILGKGYVGMSLYKCLYRCFDVIHLSRQELDYTNRHVLKNYIKGQKEPIRLVINTCGYTGRPNVDACEHNIPDTWYYNVVVPVNIQKVCKDLIVPMIHISSGCIYTGYDKNYTEDDEPNFGLHNSESSWYSKTKHACEMMLGYTNIYISYSHAILRYIITEKYFDQVVKIRQCDRYEKFAHEPRGSVRICIVFFHRYIRLG